MSMNKWIISLRDLKVAIIEEIQCVVQELTTIQSSLHPSKHLPIPSIPSLHPDEVPEKKFQYDCEMLFKFKQELEDRAKAKETMLEAPSAEGIGGFGGGFLHVASVKEIEVITRGLSVKGIKVPSGLGIPASKTFEIERAEPTEMELEISRREEIRNIHLQENLINRVRVK